ncbi:MAG: AAA family ATPase [Candidatus Liptonbacteria bacterium]|nr:AAA family ATPase [Candidatus Liptonbacteria bacterium]
MANKILGHTAAIKVLKRLATAREFAHGYLFFGPAGVGKRLIAESLAHYSEGGPFEPATRVLNDARIVEPDTEGKIGIEAARELKIFLYAKPNVSAYRLAIIDDAHRMTPEAQNALLKVAEEPPASGVLILITSDKDGLLPTLQSRLHQVYFGMVSTSHLTKWLKEERGMGDKEAQEASLKALGSPARVLEEEQSKEKKAARQFLGAVSAARKELVKKIIAPVDFNLVRFLDACIELTAEEFLKGKSNSLFWHRLLALREEARRGSLNPRLQLLALFES